MKIGMYVGSTTGNTQSAGEKIKAAFDAKQPGLVEMFNVRTADFDTIKGFDVILLGCPTWNVGELQEDWLDRFPEFKNVSFEGKKVALFSVGDQVGYVKNFQDALGIVGNEVVAKGGELYGFWPTDDYNFEMSEGVVDKHFLGLALDDDNESHKTDARIARWCERLMAELGVA